MSDLEQMVDFNPDTAEAAASRDTYIPGWYYGGVGKVVKSRSKVKPDGSNPKYFMLVLTMKPLQDPTDPDTAIGRGVRTWQCLPFEPPHWADEFDEVALTKLRKNLGHFTRSTHELLHALLGEEIVPDVPRKDRESGEVIYRGEVIDSETWDACKKEAYTIAAQVAGEYWNGERDLSELTECGAFFNIFYEDGNNNPSIKWFNANHPVRDGQEVQLASEIEAEEDPTPPPKKTNKKANGATGRAKAAKTKKKAKGRGRARA